MNKTFIQYLIKNIYILCWRFSYIGYMKKITLLLLLISFLFQSCFSYRTLDYNKIAIEKKQKFEIEKLDSSKLTGRLVSKNDQSITLENNRGIQTVEKSDIQQIKVRKFSIIKLAGGVVGTYAAVVLVIVALIAGLP